MAQRVRSVENIPEEAAALAEVASRLIEVDPNNRRAFAELAAILGAGAVGAGLAAATGSGASAVAAFSSLPVMVATVAKFLAERREGRVTGTLPQGEQQLWEDAGASFDPRAIAQDAINAASAFSDLVLRSVEGDNPVAGLLRVDRSRVSQRVRDRSLYAFSRGDTRYFPRWQFVDGSTLPGLREVLTALDQRLHPLVVDHWFLTPSVDLEVNDASVSPVVWLTTGGNVEAAAELASDL